MVLLKFSSFARRKTVELWKQELRVKTTLTDTKLKIQRQTTDFKYFDERLCTSQDTQDTWRTTAQARESANMRASGSQEGTKIARGLPYLVVDLV